MDFRVLKEDTDIDTFIARRPDGLAFDKENFFVYY